MGPVQIKEYDVRILSLFFLCEFIFLKIKGTGTAHYKFCYNLSLFDIFVDRFFIIWECWRTPFE